MESSLLHFQLGASCLLQFVVMTHVLLVGAVFLLQFQQFGAGVLLQYLVVGAKAVLQLKFVGADRLLHLLEFGAARRFRFF